MSYKVPLTLRPPTLPASAPPSHPPPPNPPAFEPPTGAPVTPHPLSSFHRPSPTGASTINMSGDDATTRCGTIWTCLSFGLSNGFDGPEGGAALSDDECPVPPRTSPPRIACTSAATAESAVAMNQFAPRTHETP